MFYWALSAKSISSCFVLKVRGFPKVLVSASLALFSAAWSELYGRISLPIRVISRVTDNIREEGHWGRKILIKGEARGKRRRERIKGNLGIHEVRRSGKKSCVNVKRVRKVSELKKERKWNHDSKGNLVSRLPSVL